MQTSVNPPRMVCKCLRQGVVGRPVRPQNLQRLQSRSALGARLARRVNVVVAEGFTAPPVSETKKKFLELYPTPVPAIYSGVLQELIVQQHFIRYNKAYHYDPIFAMGVTSAFDQILEDLGDEGQVLFEAYIESLGEDPKQYRSDSKALEEACSGLEGISSLVPSDGESTPVSEIVSKVAAQVKEGNFHYNKFFAIGLFRLLELTGVKEPQALGTLVESMGVKQDAVNRDLKMYKNVLSKLSAGKELMEEIMAREKKKAAERAAEKAAKAEAEAKSETETKAEATTESAEA
ncbi:hypothetical protein BSKO_04436 [Bryopsis sp. KO-2023]|nr:hypothetical protein BSKO_04436 [Bryopsis sp. KO-2023]